MRNGVGMRVYGFESQGFRVSRGFGVKVKVQGLRLLLLSVGAKIIFRV